jgi:GTP 3',8-cyclase
VGFITPLSHTFCADCNRLRLTARGDLRLCLFAERDYPLRPCSPPPTEHMLTRGSHGNLESFMQIGG